MDALWAGLPLLTLIGNSFASRVAASALKAVNLPELIAQTPEQYEAMALKLARDAASLAQIRARLREARTTAPLFDAHTFTRDLESAFETMWARHREGAPPVSFAVARPR